MLYDNGPLLGLYADLRAGDRRRAVRRRRARHRRLDDARDARRPTARSTRASTPTARARKGSSTSGTRDEVRALLSPDDYAVAAPHYGLDGPPNFEGHAWNLRVSAPLADVAAELGIPLAGGRRPARGARRRRCSRRAHGACGPASTTRFSRRGMRSPSRASPARRARSTSRSGRISPLAAADALRRTAWRDGRLLATRKGERAHLNAYLDDHAFLLAALLELMQTRFRVDDYALGARARRRAAGRVRRHASTAASSSRATTTSGSSIGRSPATTTRRRRATASRRARSSRSAICARSRATSRRASARCGCSRRRSRARPPGFRRCWRREADASKPPTSVLLAGDRGDVRDVAAELLAHAAPGGARLQRRGRGACRPSSSRAPRRERGALAWLCVGTSCLPPIADFAGIERALEAARAD